MSTDAQYTDDDRDYFMRRFADLPIEHTVSEARFIEAFDNAENPVSFWNAMTRITCDRYMDRYKRQVR